MVGSCRPISSQHILLSLMGEVEAGQSEEGGSYFTNLLNEGQYDACFEEYGTIPFESQHSCRLKRREIPHQSHHKSKKGKILAWMKIGLLCQHG